MKSEMAVLWSRSSRMGVFLATFLGMGLSFSALAVDIDLNPASIVWNTNTWVDITVSNIPPSESVYLGLYVDVNTNGSVDGPDVLLGQFTVQDGVTNALGSRVIPCDRDGQTNGVISAQVSYYGVGNIAGLSHGVGPHLWKATAVGSGDTAVSQFSVTQPTSTVWITGQVIDSATTNPVAGAFVELWPSFYHDMPLPKTWSSTNGAFHIFLPPEFNRHNLGGVGVNKPGYFMQEEDEQGLGLSDVQFTNSLSLGENVLQRPLYVSSSIPTQLCSLSGCVYDAATNPVAGILVSLDIESEDDDGGWSFAITDTNGVYALTMAKGAGPASVYPAGPGVNRLGLVAVGLDVGTITGDISGLDIYCPIATTLAKASVTDANSGVPVAGVTIAFGGDAMGNWGVTIDDGTYEIGLVAATNFEAGVDDEDELRGFGYVTANRYEGLDVPGSGIYTNAPFRLERGYLLTGNVYDEATNALAFGFVEAREPGGEWVGGADVNNQGYYEILLATGVYRIATWEYHELGYLNMAYSNYYTWDNWNYDPVTVTTAGLSGVDFYLPQAARIQGVVRGDGNPLAGIGVSIGEKVGEYGWEGRGGSVTDENGFYSCSVQPGSNYIVNVWIGENEGSFWRSQYYDHATYFPEASLVTADIDAPATNIDFDLEQGCIISGWVFEDDGTTPVQWCWVAAENLDGYFEASSGTFDSGYFEIVVPPGEYRVYAEGSRASSGVDMYYSGWFKNERDLANVVTAYVGEVTGNINFVMAPAGTISGRVTEDDGTTPVAWCWVEAQLDGNGMGGGQTDEEGYYSFRVPAGIYTVAARPDWEGLPYLAQYYSNAIFEADAAEVVVSVSNDTSGIDFLLSAGGKISGHVYDETGTNPLVNCHVFASEYDSNNWSAGSDTDSEGAYSLRVWPGTYRVRAFPAQNGLLYESKFYDDTFSYDSADPVVVGESSDADGVDFTLNAAGTISGNISVSGGGALQDCHVGAEDALTGEWMAWDDSAADGSYMLVLPAGSYRVRALPTNRGMPYLDTFYTNNVNRDDAVLVSVTGTNETPGIDFTLMSPSYFQGRVTDEATDMPVEGLMVFAISIPDTNNFWNDWSYYSGDPTDSNGYYAAPVPPGDHYIIFASSGDSYFIGECWSNQTDLSQADLLGIGAASTVTDIDFALEAGGRITGHVFRDDNGMPLESCSINAQYVDSGDWALGGQTDSSGYYTLILPAGHSYRIRTLPSFHGQPYVDEWFDDTLDWAEAEAVPVTLTNETYGVDFSLMVADLDHTSWLSHYFTPSELGDPDICGDSADPDHDGADNMEEFMADTNPRASDSVLRLTGNNVSGSGFGIDWKGGRWARQYLQRCDNLASNDWTDIYTNDALPTGVTNSVLDSGPDNPASFYRIRADRHTGF